MITSKKNPVKCNIGRPTILPETINFWKQFHDFVEQTPMPISVNAIYPLMKQFCDEGSFYGGGGFQYCFWFETQEDCDTFNQRVDEMWQQHKKDSK